jgi:hypothetical protein
LEIALDLLAGFASVEGYGIVQDRMGIACFYNELSSDFKQLVSTLPSIEL